MKDQDKTKEQLINNPEKSRARFPQWERYAWVLAVVWTVVVAASLVWNVVQVRHNTLEAARIQARVAHGKDVIYRRWNAGYGGVYVPVTEVTKPNPYLSDLPERDITTPSGKLLTLMNPAYMTRQVHELAEEEYGVRGHITSLKPIRPENAPDPWETEALQAFECGETEISSVEEMEGEEYMRLMRPLITEKGCLKCHAAQGYQEGDIRGGISVSIPVEPLWTVARMQVFTLAGGHAMLWLMGLGGIVLGTQRLRRNERERRRAKEALRDSEERYRDLFENASDLIQSVALDGHLVYVNRAWRETLGYDEEEIASLSLFDIIHPDSQAHCMEVFQRVTSGEEVDNVEAVFVSKDGKEIAVEGAANCKFVDGKPIYTRGIFRDITERKRAEEEIKRRAAQAALAYEVGQRVSAKLEPDELLSEIVTAVRDAFDYYGVMMLLLDDKAEYLTLQSIAGGYINIFPEDLRLAVGEGMIGYAAASGETQVSGDVSKDPHYVRKAKEETKSELAVPIKSGQKVIGVLDLQSNEFDAFDETDVMLIETLTGQIAVAIENAQLYEETQQRALEQETLREAALALTTALDRSEVIDRILAQLQRVVPYDSASVQLLQGDRLVIIGGHGFPNLPDLLGITFPANGDNPNSEVIRTRASFIVEDAPAVYEAFREDPHRQAVIRSWLGVPLLVGERLVGMIALDKCEPGFYTQQHARLAEAFAAQGAIAIENARLFEEIEERRLYLETVLGAAPDAIVTLDDRFQVVEWNAGAERLFGYSREEAVGQHLDHLVTSPDVLKEAIGFTQRVLGGKELPPTEAVRYRKDGSPVDVIVAGSPIFVGDELIGAVAVYTDITARVRMEETLRALALLDELTDLYNRRGFFTLGQQQLKAAQRGKRRMALLFADFNGLKQINDAFGHPEGDRALIETAEVLEETFRESDIIARIGGDEFAVLAIETNGSPAEVLIHRLRENLEARNARGDRPYELSLSVGLAHYDPEAPCSLDELVAQADRAMYEQKKG